MRVSECSDALPAGGGGTTRGPVRWLRGGVVGLAATVLAGAGHAIAGGMLPDAEHLALLALAATGTAVWLSGRRWSTPSLLVVLLGAQGLFHVVSGEATPMSAMHHQAPAGTMVAAHVVAAVATALLLRRGEDWCWSLLDLLRRPWSAPVAPAVVPALRLDLDRHTGRSRVPVPEWYAGAVGRRGPPAPRVA